MKKNISLLLPILVFPILFIIYFIISPFIASWLSCGIKIVNGERVDRFCVNDLKLYYFIFAGLTTVLFSYKNIKLVRGIYRYLYVLIYVIYSCSWILLLHNSILFIYK